MRLIQIILRPIYHLLYHQFAWAYDFVAAFVSLGRWQDWVRTALPYLHGRVLEVGFGPGHLQLALKEIQPPSFGLDESRQMGRQASRRLRKKGLIPCLIRGYAHSMPFASGAFDSVIATFPSEYIFDPRTLLEIRRLLVPSGKLVILPMAWITGKRPLERLVAWLMRFVGEAPATPGSVSIELRERFTRAGFTARSEIVNLEDSQVLVIVAEKGR